ncbi:MAG: late competence development ComFB family protein [Deltaproteobacteria bacterium]|nr:late competence development ComFB family protein [Deltaproteobacteria bacterium]
MSIFRDKYKMGHVDFFNVRNRNEGRVVRVIQELLHAKGSPKVSSKDLHDIYALALNALPPRYTQRGTIVVDDPVKKAEISSAVENAYVIVLERPRP